MFFVCLFFLSGWQVVPALFIDSPSFGPLDHMLNLHI